MRIFSGRGKRVIAVFALASLGMFPLVTANAAELTADANAYPNGTTARVSTPECGPDGYYIVDVSGSVFRGTAGTQVTVANSATTTILSGYNYDIAVSRNPGGGETLYGIAGTNDSVNGNIKTVNLANGETKILTGVVYEGMNPTKRLSEISGGKIGAFNSLSNTRDGNLMMGSQFSTNIYQVPLATVNAAVTGADVTVKKVGSNLGSKLTVNNPSGAVVPNIIGSAGDFVPAIDGGLWWLVSAGDGDRVVHLDPMVDGSYQTGQLMGRLQFPGSARAYGLTVANGRFIVAASNGYSYQFKTEPTLQDDLADAYELENPSKAGTSQYGAGSDQEGRSECMRVVTTLEYQDVTDASSPVVINTASAEGDSAEILNLPGPDACTLDGDACRWALVSDLANGKLDEQMSSYKVPADGLIHVIKLRKVRLPKSGEVTVERTSPVGPEQAKAAVANADAFPAGTSFAFIDQVDTSIGSVDLNRTVRVTYPDGTTTSVAVTVHVRDTIAPPAPQIAVAKQEPTAISGTGEPGSNVEICVSAKEQPQPRCETVTVGPDGNYSLNLDVPLVDGDTITAVATDPYGNRGPQSSVELDWLNTLSDQAIDPNGESLSGKTDPGAKVVITDSDGNTLGEAVADEQGNYQFAFKSALVDGQKLKLVSTDPAGNVSTGEVGYVKLDKDKYQAEAGKVTVERTSQVGPEQAKAAVANAESFPEGTSFAFIGPVDTSVGNKTVEAMVRVTYPDGSTKEIAVQVEVLDRIAPQVPTINVDSEKSATVTGRTEPGATVKIRRKRALPDAAEEELTVIADSNGDYTATFTDPMQDGDVLEASSIDAYGNTESKSVVTIDSKNMVMDQAVSDGGTVVSGKTDPGATVVITDSNGGELGRAKADEQGNFQLVLKEAVSDGASVTITSTDADGNTAIAQAVWNDQKPVVPPVDVAVAPVTPSEPTQPVEPVVQPQQPTAGAEKPVVAKQPVAAPVVKPIETKPAILAQTGTSGVSVVIISGLLSLLGSVLIWRRREAR